MKLCLLKLLPCLLFPFAAALAEGQQRVLLSFDGAGHQVRQIVRTDNSKSLSAGTTRSTVARTETDLTTLKNQLQPGFATLVWFDENGHWQANTIEPDPRISHAPAHISSVNESRLGEVTGAWLVTGPGEAKTLTVLLPPDPSLSLAFEQWNVDLSVHTR